MSFLSIAQRELRVTARRKSTFIIRGAAALLALVIGGFWLLMLALSGPAPRAAGAWMFMGLSWYALLISLLAGVFLAADSLSEERREGTLGFLFLTDLAGCDVVLGKFMAVSLNAFYGLLAVFPVFALCLVAGGVTPGEFTRTCLALVNVLFFSVAAALWVSARSRSFTRAMSGSICLIVTTIVAGGLALATPLPLMAALSPFESFRLASEAQYLRQAKEFWTALAVSHLAGWMLLGWAGWHLRSFVDEEDAPGVWQRLFARILPRGRASRRAALLEINPVLWLLDDSRRMRWVAWVLALAGAAVLLSTPAKLGPAAAPAAGFLVWPFYFLLKVFFAIQACRFFSEARRTGALELLCCTPLTMRTIIQGQWMALRRVFLWPVIVLLCAHAVVIAAMLSDSPVLTGTAGTGLIKFTLLWAAVKTVPNSVADFFALGWFGMWLALTLQRPAMATGLTILYVLILPTIAFCVPTLAIDAVFIVIGSGKLSQDFRLRDATRGGPHP
jgi:ABC-type transport system involved in multi-copper enzyme maturation permease subunit